MAKESSFYQRLGKWYLENTDYPAIEIKLSKSNRMPFSAVPPHQEAALANKWYYKIPDVGIAKKPLDIVFKRTPAPLVVVYQVKGTTEVYEIPIRAFLKEKYTSGSKSLHKDRAAELGIKVLIGG
jgi:hypothetical protein